MTGLPPTITDHYHVRIDYCSKDESLYFLAGTLFRMLPKGAIGRFRYASDSMERDKFTPEFIENKKLEWKKHLDERIKNYETTKR